MGILGKISRDKFDSCDIVYRDCLGKVRDCNAVTDSLTGVYYENGIAKFKNENNQHKEHECNCSNNDELFAASIRLLLKKQDEILEKLDKLIGDKAWI